MSVAKIIEISSTSDKSFEDAIKTGIARASKTIDNIRGAWVEEQKFDISKVKMVGYQVNLQITFVLTD